MNPEQIGHAIDIIAHHIANNPPPQQASDFTSFSKPGQICHICSQPGVVLAYDIFVPQVGMWFCERDWKSLHWPILASFLEVVEDRRVKEQAE